MPEPPRPYLGPWIAERHMQIIETTKEREVLGCIWIEVIVEKLRLILFLE
jgi:hypothetical protein